MRIPRRLYVFICAQLWLVLFTACNEPAASLPADAVKPESADASTVKVMHPERRTLTLKIEQPGHVEAFESTPIFAKVAGYVQKVNVDIDDKVDAGKVLVEIDVPETVEEVKQRAAAVDVATAKVQLTREAFKVAEARLETTKAAYDRWESESNRVDGLVRSKVIDAQTGDETLNQFKAAAATHKESLANRDLARVAIDAARAYLREAEADHKRLQALLDYAQIKTPYPCVVTLRNVHTGWFVQPPSGDKREPLLIVERRDLYRVVIEVPETSAAFVNKGVAATIGIPALGGQGEVLKVQRTARSLDAKTRTLRAEFDWAKPPDWVRPGQYVTAMIVVEHKNVWTLPESAVFVKDGQVFCCRVVDGKIVRTPIHPGIKQGGRVETRGPDDWKETDEVVATNPGSYEDGLAVKVAP
jgi:HlyD family secretion protein